MINTGRFHVYPEEIRQALLMVSGVSDALVRGERDERRGEAVVAYVTTTVPLTPERLRSSLADVLATYKVPSCIHLTDELPISDSAKNPAWPASTKP